MSFLKVLISLSASLNVYSAGDLLGRDPKIIFLIRPLSDKSDLSAQKEALSRLWLDYLGADNNLDLSQYPAHLQRVMEIALFNNDRKYGKTARLILGHDFFRENFSGRDRAEISFMALSDLEVLDSKNWRGLQDVRQLHPAVQIRLVHIISEEAGGGAAEAAEILKKRKPRRLIRALVEVMKDPHRDPVEREKSWIILRQMDPLTDQQMLSHIISVVLSENTSAYLREQILDDLKQAAPEGGIEPDEITPAHESAGYGLLSERSDTRKTAQRLLDDIFNKDSALQSYLRKSVAQGDPYISEDLFKILDKTTSSVGKITPNESTELALVEALACCQSFVRERALKALRYAHLTENIKQALSLLESDPLTSRKERLQAQNLLKFGGERRRKTVFEKICSWRLFRKKR